MVTLKETEKNSVAYDLESDLPNKIEGLNEEEEIDSLQQETSIINQLIKDQYSKKNNNSTISTSGDVSELDILIYKNSMAKLFYLLETQSYTVNKNTALNIKYNSLAKEATLKGKNKGGFIKFNNGKSITTDLHILNPFEVLYNLERLTPVIVDDESGNMISVENFYSEISYDHLEDYKIYSHFKRLGYMLVFDWWSKEYDIEKTMIKSTFFSLKRLLGNTNTISGIFRGLYDKCKFFFIKSVQHTLIQSTQQFQAYMQAMSSVTRSTYPKSLKELYDNHKKFNKHNSTDKNESSKSNDQATQPNFLNIYKSTVSKTQTIKHPHLPDFQLVSADKIPHISQLPFEELDYKFSYLADELFIINAEEPNIFDSQTFVRYFDKKKGEWNEISRTNFLAKKKKTNTQTPQNNGSPTKNKKSKKRKGINSGRSLICSLNGFEDVFLEFSEVELI